jgi:hypothetical protein
MLIKFKQYTMTDDSSWAIFVKKHPDIYECAVELKMGSAIIRGKVIQEYWRGVYRSGRGAQPNELHLDLRLFEQVKPLDVIKHRLYGTT